MKITTFASLIAFIASSFAQSCYFTDGSLSPDDVPCKDVSTGGVSMCCAANEYCFSNGLCVSPSTLTFNRGSCTDQSWQSSGCAQYCTSELYAGIWACDSKNDFSCSPNNCTDTFNIPGGEAIWNNQLKMDLGVAASSASSASSQLATASPTVTATVTAQASCTATAAAAAPVVIKSSGVATGVAVAGFVLFGVALIALLATIVLLVREKRKNRNTNVDGRPGALTEMHHQHPSSYQSQQSAYKYQNPPPAFGAGGGFASQQNKPLPAEMGQATEIPATELSGTPAYHR